MKRYLPRKLERVFLLLGFCIDQHANEVDSLKTAAIGIGSNSLRMLVAEIADGRLRRLGRYREGLRVFAALDDHKNILPEMIEAACKHVLAFKNEAKAQGAETVHLFATSAVRDAANQKEFAQGLLNATGLELEICSGDEEAFLSFWGASEETPTGLIDIGGGSTEIAIGCGRDIEDAVSLQMGAVRLFRKMPIQSAEDAWRVVDSASSILAPVLERFVQKGRNWVGVGGTFTTSAALAQRIPWKEREKIHGYALTRQKVEEILRFLSPMPLEERLALDCLQPQRADIVCHGIAILLACMNQLDIPVITVSEYGNLEGYLKAKYLFSKKI